MDDLEVRFDRVSGESIGVCGGIARSGGEKPQCVTKKEDVSRWETKLGNTADTQIGQ